MYDRHCLNISKKVLTACTAVHLAFLFQVQSLEIGIAVFALSLLKSFYNRVKKCTLGFACEFTRVCKAMTLFTLAVER